MLFTKKFIKKFSSCRSHFSSVSKEINISSLNYNLHPDAYDVIVIGGGHAGCEAAYGSNKIYKLFIIEVCRCI